MVLILVIGLIHLIDAPGSFADATYKGILFLLVFLGGIVAAVGIYRQSWSYGWILGLIIAVSTFIGHVISRTVGLPQIPRTCGLRRLASCRWSSRQLSWESSSRLLSS
jgi:hypothetical protein